MILDRLLLRYAHLSGFLTVAALLFLYHAWEEAKIRELTCATWRDGKQIVCTNATPEAFVSFRGMRQDTENLPDFRFFSGTLHIGSPKEMPHGPQVQEPE